MAINLFDNITNPVSGEMFKCLSISNELYTMRWTLQPKGYVPFEHIHLHQDEVFDVQRGELKIIIDGITHFAGKGDRVVVPKGSRHIASNNSDEVMEAIVSYSPALDMDKFFQCLGGLTLDGHLDGKGGVSIPMMGYCLTKMKCKAMSRPTNIPSPAFGLALKVFYVIGLFKGWRKLYNKYTR